MFKQDECKHWYKKVNLWDVGIRLGKLFDEC